MGYIALKGALLCAGLIMVIGSQNAFLLKTGLKTPYVMWAATVCFVGDIILISAGVLGFGTLIAESEFLSQCLAWCGAAFVFVYGVSALRSAWHFQGDLKGDSLPKVTQCSKIILAAAVMTFLNPHVYLDAFVLIGGIAAPLTLTEKLWFLSGALSASGVWFYGLGFCIGKMRNVLTHPTIWRLLDVVVAVIMFVVGIELVMSALG